MLHFVLEIEWLINIKKFMIINFISFFIGKINLNKNHSISKFSRASKKYKGNKKIEFAIFCIQNCWVNNEIVNRGKHDEPLPKIFIEKMAWDMLKNCLKILSSDNPRMKNREFLANAVIRCADIQVLIMPPPPHEDETHMRGRCGITGELKLKLMDIFRVNKKLQEMFHSFDGEPDFDDIFSSLLYSYHFAAAEMNVYGMLRYIFDDFNPVEERDWLGPFFLSMCAFSEAKYRSELKLPSSLNEDPESRVTIRSLIYSTFLNFVMRGDRYPDLTWESKYKDKSIEGLKNR